MLDALEAFCFELVSLCYSGCYFYNSNGALVAESITVSRSGEDSQGQGLLVGVILILEALHLHLMASDDHLDVVGLKKFCSLRPTIEVRAGSHLIVHPIFMAIISRIAPEHVAKRTVIGDLNEPVNLDYVG